MRGNVAPRKSKIKFAYFCGHASVFFMDFEEKSDFFKKNLDFQNFLCRVALL